MDDEVLIRFCRLHFARNSLSQRLRRDHCGLWAFCMLDLRRVPHLYHSLSEYGSTMLLSGSLIRLALPLWTYTHNTFQVISYICRLFSRALIWNCLISHLDHTSCMPMCYLFQGHSKSIGQSVGYISLRQASFQAHGVVHVVIVAVDL
jgi:hypothetical protein